MKKISLIILIFILLFVFSACTPKTMEKAKAKMEKKGYTVEAYILEDDEIVYLNNKTENGLVKCIIPMTEKVKGRLSAYRTDSDITERLSALYFEAEIKAINYYNKYKDEMENDENCEFVQKGKWVISGTAQAIKDFTS